MFVCELSWTGCGGAIVVEVFGVWWISVVLACIACLGGRRGSSFVKVIVVGAFGDVLRSLGMTC